MLGASSIVRSLNKKLVQMDKREIERRNKEGGDGRTDEYSGRLWAGLRKLQRATDREWGGDTLQSRIVGRPRLSSSS